MTAHFDSSTSRELRLNSSRHTHRLSGTLDVPPFLHGSDFTLLVDTSSPMSVHATCLHLVRRLKLFDLSLISHTKLNWGVGFAFADVVSTTPQCQNTLLAFCSTLLTSLHGVLHETRGLPSSCESPVQPFQLVQPDRSGS